jgi:hypothetical protein
MKRGPEHYPEAYQSLLHLRGLPLLAAKELFYVHSQIEIEKKLLSKRGHDTERHNQQGSNEVFTKDRRGLRRRRERPSDDSTKEPVQTNRNTSEPVEKWPKATHGRAASESGDRQWKDRMPDPTTRRFSTKPRTFWKKMWQRFKAPQNRSINYWQKLGQLLTERRIRRVFLKPLFDPGFANHSPGHNFSRCLHDISTALWC